VILTGTATVFQYFSNEEKCFKVEFDETEGAREDLEAA
jgi:hypothetical protein